MRKVFFMILFQIDFRFLCTASIEKGYKGQKKTISVYILPVDNYMINSVLKEKFYFDTEMRENCMRIYIGLMPMPTFKYMVRMR